MVRPSSGYEHIQAVRTLLKIAKSPKTLITAFSRNGELTQPAVMLYTYKNNLRVALN